MKQLQDENKTATVNGWELIEAMWCVLTYAFDDARGVLDTHGVGRKPLILLAILDRADTPQALAQELQAPASTISHMLRDLEAAELITRSVSERDRRRFHLVRTTKGDEALRAGRAAINSLLGEKMARFSEADRTILARALPLLRALVSEQAPTVEEPAAP